MQSTCFHVLVLWCLHSHSSTIVKTSHRESISTCSVILHSFVSLKCFQEIKFLIVRPILPQHCHLVRAHSWDHCGQYYLHLVKTFTCDIQIFSIAVNVRENDFSNILLLFAFKLQQKTVRLPPKKIIIWRFIIRRVVFINLI